MPAKPTFPSDQNSLKESDKTSPKEHSCEIYLKSGKRF